MSLFSENLKLLRQESGLKQAEIAEKVGINASQWSTYEVGRAEPNIDLLVKISTAFNVSIDTLCVADISPIVKSLIKGNLKLEGKQPKKYPKGNETGNPKGNLTVNEGPLKGFQFGNEEDEHLTETLKKLVESKDEVISFLKEKNEELKAALKSEIEKNAKGSESHA